MSNFNNAITKRLFDTPRFSRHPNRVLLAAECPIVQIEAKVVGGEEAPIGRYPWLALLGYGRKQNEENMTWECGGALIGDQFVLTAAHCFDLVHLPSTYSTYTNSTFQVIAGEHDLRNNNDGATRHDIANITLHSNWKYVFGYLERNYHKDTIRIMLSGS